MNNKLSLKIAIAQVCTFAATSSFAYLPDTQNNQYHWYSALTATLMKPSNLNYEETFASPVFTQTLIKPHFQWGVNALLGRLLSEQNDISANYTYNEFNDSHSTSTSAIPDFFNFFNTSERVSYQVNYDALALSLGHYINTARWNTHLYGGVDYTYIQQSVTSLTTNPIRTPTTEYSRSKMTFNGVGPQFGLETGFKVNSKLKLIGGVNLAFLASNISLVGSPNTFNGALKTQANLGVSYDQIIRNDTKVSIELGYKTVLVQNMDSGEGGSVTKSYAFAMNGPYLGLGVTC
jgi:hypothetical protein